MSSKPELNLRERDVPRVALTPAEATQSLDCSPEVFREHIDSELRWIRRGGQRFVPVSELEQWAEGEEDAVNGFG